MQRIPRPFALLIALMLALPAWASTDEDSRWYVVRLNGDKVGWMEERTATNDNAELVSTTVMHMTIARGVQPIEIEVRSEFIETPQGEPLRMRSYQSFGLSPLETRYVFTDEGVKVTTLQNGRRTTKMQDTPEGDWLTPGEVTRFVRTRMRAGAQTIAFSSIDAGAGLTPVREEWTVIGDTTVEVFGKTVPAQEWRITESMAGTTSSAFVDKQGNALKTTVFFGGLTIEMLAADEALAKAPFDAPEMMNASLVRIDESIPGARDTRRASFLLRHTGDEPVDLFAEGVFLDAGVQRTERVDDRSVRIVVDLDDNRPAPVTDALRADALGAGAYIDPTDPELVALAERAAAESPGFDGATALEKAKLLERFVDGYVRHKNLGVGFATSSEVCRTREGDCSEHAMLLAALLRAHGIPARVATGLVYADGFMGERRIFGYHMWTQALIETDAGWVWHDVDAAIGTMDATHIAIDASTFADDDPVQGMLDVVTVFGALEIEVESVE
ncbi:MAG: hypothetical protein Tsb0013_08380 [Phycisphaerales bacterium]